MSQSKQYTHLYYSVIKSQAENALIGFCNCFTQDNGTSGEENRAPEPDDKNRLKVIHNT